MSKSLNLRILVAAVAGVSSAWLLADDGWREASTRPDAYAFILMLKDAFLGALEMLVGPMVFLSLIAGIIGIGDVTKLRTIGTRALGYYLATTGAAIALGLGAVLFVHPWTSVPAAVSLPASMTAGVRPIHAADASLFRVVGQMLESALVSPVAALYDMNILGIVTNAVLFGLAITMAVPEQSSLREGIRAANDVVAKVLQWVIQLLPVGIFAILFDFTVHLHTSRGGALGFLTQLMEFAALVVGLTLVHGLLVLPTIGAVFAKRAPVETLRRIAKPLIVAFSTSSSSATLPVSMRTCDEELGVSPSVSSFVLPLGATMNMDGTALFEAVAAVFLAHLYGVELSGASLFVVFLMAMVASIGAPGMPSASMSGMQLVLLSVGIPLEAIAILLVVERPLDAIRTAVNVEGDLFGAMVVDHQLRSVASGANATPDGPS